jgi:hypothetical protein
MALVKRNQVTKGLSGKFHDFLFKQYSYGTVVSKIPDRSKVKLSKKQKAANTVFKAAVAYAKGVIKDPKKRGLYEAKLKPGKKVYHAALADYLHKHKRPAS